MNPKLLHPDLDEGANEETSLPFKGYRKSTNQLSPLERRSFTWRSGAFLLLAGLAACLGLFLFLIGLAEHPAASRIVVELVLFIPLAALIVWNVAKRVWK